MAQAVMGDTVLIHFNGKLRDGTQFETSKGRDPLEFKIGDRKIIPTLEASVVGMSIGDKATVEIAAADAFGPHLPEAVRKVDRSEVPDGVDLTPGAQVEANTQDGQRIVLRVIEVDDATVTLDGNHPLAGEDLVFEIELVEIMTPAG